VDHDGYDHTPGSEDIADSFDVFPYSSIDDFDIVDLIDLVVDDGTLQKSVATYRNDGTADPMDIQINQTCWTVTNKDWGILQYNVENIKSPGADITNFCLGLEIPFSKDGARYGVGGTITDGGDDIDGYDASEDVYWVQDSDTGISIGVGSVITSDPISHYYAEDYHAVYDPQYKNYFGNDSWLYNRLHAPNTLATDGINPGNVTTTVGWNGETIISGDSRTYTFVIAANNSQSNMIEAINDARDYYQTLLTGFQITEICDSESSTPKIEVYSNGREPTDPGTVFSLSSNAGPLSGVWSTVPIPTYGYSVFTANEILDPEGDTISLYEGGNQIDQVAYGTRGVAPDPLAGESTARYWDSSISGYNDDWTREDSPTWGAQNDVPPANFSSAVLLNEIMFNPITPGDRFVSLYIRFGSLNISGYKIVCDTVYMIPNGLTMGPGMLFFNFTEAMDPSFFANMDPNGDNVYLYDDNGSLLDMAGWSTSHTQGKPMRRVPDGNGTRDGYDDDSSIAAGWVFDFGPPLPPPPPAPPMGLMSRLISFGADIMLTWNGSNDDGFGEDDVVGYTVYKSTTGINGTYDFAAWIPATDSLTYNWIDVDSGDGDWNNYFYMVRANDTTDNQENNTNKVGKFVHYIYDNWNMFSVPLIQFEGSLNYVLQTIEGNYTAIHGYHAGKSRPWLHWHKKKPPSFNDVIKIDHKSGYYIKMTNPDYLVVTGAVSKNTLISLKTGWNLIGYPSLINKTVEYALSSIWGKYNMVEYYDPMLGKEVRLNPTDYMQPGYGYWIHTTEDCILIL
jgi:hypothetical protein